MSIEIDFHGVPLSASDFPHDLRGWIAFTILFASNTTCGNREAAIELLLYEADKIIEHVKEGAPPKVL